MEKWIEFYEPAFPSRAEAEAFVGELESINDPKTPRHRAKIMMHQAQRLVSLADDIVAIRKGKESLQLLFLLTCAENIAKLFHNFEEDGQSKAFVRRFFSEFVIGDDKSTLERSLFTYQGVALNVQEVTDALYSVRCDVVHEGRYWGFSFHDGNTPIFNSAPDVQAHITIEQFRSIVVRGCVRAVQAYAAP